MADDLDVEVPPAKRPNMKRKPGQLRPEVIGVTRARERARVARWLMHWADVRLRDEKTSAPDLYAADIVKSLGRYIRDVTSDELIDLSDKRWRVKRRDYVKKRRDRAKEKGIYYRGY